MESITNHEGKPVLDEATFQRLLAAAYVLQEHRKQIQPRPEPVADNHHDADYATTLGEIVETQQQILLRHLDLDGAAGLVVEQTQKMTAAAGAAVCMVNRDHLVYRAVKGTAAAEMGQAVPCVRALSAQVLAHGAVVRCADVLTDLQVDAALAKRAGIACFIAVPIFHDDQIAGVIELAFSKPYGYAEQDVRTCQLMAGLVTEAITRTSDDQSKKNLTAERDSMLEALEKLKPQLDRLAKDAEALSASATPVRMRPTPPAEPARAISMPLPSAMRRETTGTPPASAPRAGKEKCSRCGNEIAPQEVYCGNCGTLRGDRSRTDSTQSRPNAWDSSSAPTAHDASFAPAGEDARRSFSSNLVDHDVHLPDEVLALARETTEQEPPHDVADELMRLLPPDPDGPGLSPPHAAPSAPTSLAVTSPVAAAAVPVPQAAVPYPWTSAADARAWLNSLGGEQGNAGLAAFFRMHRGDLSLGAAIVALLIALFWGMSSHRSTPANSEATDAARPTTTSQSTGAPQAGTAPVRPQRRAPQTDPELSWTERALVSLGLADPPPPVQQYAGNPDVSVWVDLRTALYYCPNADLYGKSEKGRYMTQRQAQIDQFEPASRKVCE
jgi:putative methionine-R-sulfoxide reductase with GAF domain